MADLNLLRILADKEIEAYKLNNSCDPNSLGMYVKIQNKLNELLKNVEFDNYYIKIKNKEMSEFITDEMYKNGLDLMMEVLIMLKNLKSRNDNRIKTTFIEWHNRKMIILEEKIEEYKINQENKE